MPHKEIHIVPNTEKGGWDSKRENAERVSKHFETQKEAMDWSREKAKQEKSELIPHGKDGKIPNPNIHGNDSNPPKDKNR